MKFLKYPSLVIGWAIKTHAAFGVPRINMQMENFHNF